MEISPLVPEKNFEGFIPYMDVRQPLGHVTSIILINFHFLVPERLHIKLVQNDPVISENSQA